MGDIQWLRPVVGITNDMLEPLKPLLKGTDPAQPVTISPMQHQSIQYIAEHVTSHCVSRRDPDLPIDVTILYGHQHLCGALTQSLKKTGESTRVLEWVFPPLQPKTTIQQKILILADLIKNCRQRVCSISGQEPETIYVPIAKNDLEWYLQNCDALASACLSNGAKIIITPLKDKILSWMSNQNWILKPKLSLVPIKNALTVFTDAGKKSQRAVATWQESGEWRHILLPAEGKDSLQTLELRAVIWVLGNWLDEPINVVSDSLYVVGIVQRIEQSMIKKVANERLYELLEGLLRIIGSRSAAYSIIHVRSHKFDLGLGEGNARADKLVSIAAPISKLAQARESHAQFHQNVKGMVKAFDITFADAQAIIQACPICSNVNKGLGLD